MIYFLIFTVFILDRFFKFLVAINLNYGDIIPVLPFLNITYLNNTGIAFSLLTGNNKILFYVNLFIVVFLVLVLVFSKLRKGLVFIAYALILGGALSNLWDRYFYNGVIDYIDFKVWPVFNIADTAITIGALLIVYSTIKDCLSIKKRTNSVHKRM